VTNTPVPQVILITGCSSGFGLLTAARLASKGHHVIATMRDPNKSPALMEEVKSRGGVVDIKRLDVTDKKSIQDAIREIGSTYGHIDILINNAGYGLGGFFEDLTDAEIRELFETNFFGVQNVIREVLPLMRPRKKGKIINISSTSGFSASPCFGAYNASKWALEGFSESLRYELKLFGIDVLLIEPGMYKTKIFYENERHASNFHNEESPYYPISKYLEARIRERVDDCHKNPEEIAILVEKLIDAKNPAFRNIPDIESQILYLLRKILPFRIFSFLIQSAIFKGMKTS
jgi:NAD(P)-dependent dehydrogenase (short-subunit alcohol dehydrogenase family)